tara:strand:- start:2062 stop:3642 length:1581 start_codon:yes stop_codon:yes gene_type:complete
MATFYAKERAKYGNLTGQIIIWPVEYEGDPTEGNNAKNLPAGYLKCNGAKYSADDYPRLAAVLGTGTATKFMKKNLDNSNFETINESQFMVPDFGSKYPEPTTGANAGVYNNVRVKNSNNQEVSRSGIAIEATNQTGSDTATIIYRGDITLPSQEIPITGKPGYTYGGTNHRTDEVAVDEDQIHPHMHAHTAKRARNMTRHAEGASPTETNDIARREGECGNWNASTINVYDWLYMTRFDQSANVTVKSGYTCTGVGTGWTVTSNGGSNCTTEEVAKNASDSSASSNNPAGSRQEVCKAMTFWNPNSGYGSYSGNSWACTSPITATGYNNGCIEGGNPNQSEFKAGCIQVTDIWYDGGETWGSPNNQDRAQWTNNWEICIPLTGLCSCLSSNTNVGSGTGQPIKQNATYVAGLTNPNVPVDFANNSLADVLPLQSNEAFNAATTGFTAVEHVTQDTAPLVQTTDPTIHDHRIDIDNTADHTYKVKTEAISVNPENLSTTMDIGTNSSPSIDGASSPFIIMEYLIKT